MEISACYNVPLSGSFHHPEDERISRGDAGRTKKEGVMMKCPKKRTRSNPRRKGDLMKIDDFEKASEFLHHFHGIASRSLDVIYEITDFSEEGADGTAEDEYYFTTGLAHMNNCASGGMRRTQTCSCLLEVQAIATSMNFATNFSDGGESKDDEDEWGFYPEGNEGTTYHHTSISPSSSLEHHAAGILMPSAPSSTSSSPPAPRRRAR